MRFSSSQLSSFNRGKVSAQIEVAHVLTNCLRVIRNAWHSYFEVAYVIKALCGSFCIALLTP